MAYSQNTALALLFQGLRESVDFEVSVTHTGVALNWFSAAPQPSDVEVDALLASPEFAAWRAEHGGDPTETLHRQAKEAVDAASPESLARRAYALAVRADTTGTKTERQLRDDAKERIDAGEVG